MGATRPLVIRRGSVQGAVVGVDVNTGSCGRIERSVVALIEVVFTGVLATHVVVVMAAVVVVVVVVVFPYCRGIVVTAVVTEVRKIAR